MDGKNVGARSRIQKQQNVKQV